MPATKVRDFSKRGDALPIPDLVEVQTAAYHRFLQLDKDFDERDAHTGLESLLREIFPIESYDGQMKLQYIYYKLDEPRYTPDECRQLRLTYGMPFRIGVRLVRQDIKEMPEEEIYLGEIPIMMGGGEFIVNGAERVIVNQLHRSPGVDFGVASLESDRPLHSARIIPERGSWIEIEVTKKDVLAMRIDQSTKIAATTFLRAMSEKLSTTAQLIAAFYDVEEVAAGKLKPEHYAAAPIIDTETGEEIVRAGAQIGEAIGKVQASSIKKVAVITNASDPLVLNTIASEPMDVGGDFTEYESALLRLYARLRPGNPPQVDKAKQLFIEKFLDENRYRLGKVGRFRINRKFHLSVPDSEMKLCADDFLATLKYIIDLRNNRGDAHTDDIDHLGNRRLRTLDELAVEEMRKGFLKLRRTVQERMSVKDPDELSKIADLINSKAISSSIDFFFGRGELSQVVDQTNPLSQLTHERRLSALGPGGLNRKRAGFEVRDVHISHYGRICPIETPEGTNIGLIASLGIYSQIDEYGFLRTPYKVVKKGKLTGEHHYLRADEEMAAILAPSDVVDENGKLRDGQALARVNGELAQVASDQVQFIDISPKQIVGVSAALIPFLEHDDANRALMGSNMQRQAVPLVRTDPPTVATGMEKDVPKNSGMVVRARNAGTVTSVDASHVVIDNADEYVLRKFTGLNEKTCLNQKPIVKLGDRVKKGQIIADGAATEQGELALGKNVLVAFNTYDGYNFEDAIVISERLVREDVFTSIHIEEFDVEIRETKLGREEFTRDIPNVSEKQLGSLDEYGVIQVGTHVRPGDILVGKVSPKSKSELTPEEKLLHAIFGRAGEDVKNDSLEVPAGTEGVVIATKRFSRRMHMSDDQKKALKKEMKEYEVSMHARAIQLFRQMVDQINEVTGTPLVDPGTRQKVGASEIDEVILEQITSFKPRWIKGSKESKAQAEQIHSQFWPRIEAVMAEKERKLAHMKRGDELPSGVLEMVKVWLATKRQLSVGDKMAGRHGNKGVIARIVPDADMPFLEDGTPVDVLLNPLGVPSRMNVGQILETHLGWACKVLDFQAVTPVFDGATEAEVHAAIEEANEHVRQATYADRVDELKFKSESSTNAPAGSIGEIRKLAEEAERRLDRISRFCRDKDYRSDDAAKQLDKDDCEYLRGRYYSEPELPSYAYVEAPKLNKIDLKVVEGALVQKYAPRFNRAGKGDQFVSPSELSGPLATLYTQCVDVIDGQKTTAWLKSRDLSDVPSACGMYFFRDGQGRPCGYVGIAAGENGLKQRLNDHFKQNSFGDNLVKRFAEDELSSLQARLALDELRRVDQAAYDASRRAINEAGQTGAILCEMPPGGKVQLRDGRTGEPFDQRTTVGVMYLLKLHHLVDDKIHARATGPYSLITQQPLGGKARTGGQRFGEMEVWALEAYGAAYILQELLTVKSDDVEGRTKIYESMVKGNNTLEAGMPVAFDVLCNEIKGLGLNVTLEKKQLEGGALL